MSNTSVVQVRVDRNLKTAAREVAEELGMPLGVMVRAFLKELVRRRGVSFSLGSYPSVELRKKLAKFEEDWSRGEGISDAFAEVGEAVSWLEGDES